MIASRSPQYNLYRRRAE